MVRNNIMGKTIKIGLLGSGTVGSGVVEVLKKNVDEISQKAGTEIEIKKILVRDLKKKRPHLEGMELTDDINDILKDEDIDIIVELMGGLHPARECATGFIESTLAQIYKLPRGKNRFHGGPAYYIQNRLHQPAVAKLFAVLISITFGLIYVSVQANTIALSLETAFTVPPLLTAAVIAILTAVSISGGMVRIARITAYFVPIMAGLYLLTAFAVILMNLDKVPGMFALIIHDAFTPQAAVGGGIGTTILTGIRRGLFSNEAGEGSVPNAAATANVSHPVKQGLVQAFGVYVDTWIVCTATAFIVLLSGQYTIGGELTGIALTQKSLESIFGGLAPGAVALMILLFAFSSVIGNYYYGEINIAFFETKSRLPLTLYRVFVVVMAAFGCVAELPLVWNLADLFMGFLALTNLYAIARLAKYACAALDDYITKKKSGITEPDFSSDTLGDSDGIHAWNSK